MKLYGCLPYARLIAAFSSQNGLAKHTLGKTAKNNALEIRQSYNHFGVTTEHDPISSMIVVDSYHSHREFQASVSTCPITDPSTEKPVSLDTSPLTTQPSVSPNKSTTTIYQDCCYRLFLNYRSAVVL